MTSIHIHVPVREQRSMHHNDLLKVVPGNVFLTCWGIFISSVLVGLIGVGCLGITSREFHNKVHTIVTKWAKFQSSFYG